jgi:hypothetical protein
VSSYGDTGGCGSVTGRRGWETGNGVGVAESRWAESLWARWRRGLWVPLLGWVFVVAVVGALVLLLVTAGSPRLAVADAVRTMATVGGALAVVVTGVFAYRRQALAERDESRADAVEFSRRYEVVVSQIGDDKAAVRLGGVYSLARLADEWVDQRQTCVDVLCAYLRMPFVAEPAEAGYVPGEIEVRTTIQRLIATHVHKDQVESSTSWSGCDFDFTGAYFRDLNLKEATFHGDTMFGGATFHGTAWFDGATFHGTAWFDEATSASTQPLEGARFVRDPYLEGAGFAGRTVKDDPRGDPGAWVVIDESSGDSVTDDEEMDSAIWDR